MTSEHTDVAREPVDLTQGSDFMDTGVFYDERLCVECSDAPAAKGSRMCKSCLKESQR